MGTTPSTQQPESWCAQEPAITRVTIPTEPADEKGHYGVLHSPKGPQGAVGAVDADDVVSRTSEDSVEGDLTAIPCARSSQSGVATSRMHPLAAVGVHGCCFPQTIPSPRMFDPGDTLESLSYTPVRFDDTWLDPGHERSHTRYGKMVVTQRTPRQRNPRRSMLWEEFLLTAQRCCPITLLTPDAQLKATYRLDAALEALTIKAESMCSQGHVCVINKIQVICPAAEFSWIVEDIDCLAALSDGEKGRAILIQYSCEEDERARVCFLEQDSAKRERFVQAMTALWLEKRNEQSLWF